VRIPAGALSTLVAGSVRVVELPRGSLGLPPVIPVEALVLRDQSGVPRAYLNRCRHLPVPLVVLRLKRPPIVDSSDFLSPDGAALECRTHGALYRLDDGMCFEGPCEGLGLFPIALEAEDDALYVIAAA
jgi:nitrite reductase/ring-hydroxylating ferredoxin subunit